MFVKALQKKAIPRGQNWVPELGHKTKPTWFTSTVRFSMSSIASWLYLYTHICWFHSQRSKHKSEVSTQLETGHAGIVLVLIFPFVRSLAFALGMTLGMVASIWQARCDRPEIGKETPLSIGLGIICFCWPRFRTAVTPNLYNSKQILGGKNGSEINNKMKFLTCRNEFFCGSRIWFGRYEFEADQVPISGVRFGTHFWAPSF